MFYGHFWTQNSPCKVTWPCLRPSKSLSTMPLLVQKLSCSSHPLPKTTPWHHLQVWQPSPLVMLENTSPLSWELTCTHLSWELTLLKGHRHITSSLFPLCGIKPTSQESEPAANFLSCTNRNQDSCPSGYLNARMPGSRMTVSDDTSSLFGPGEHSLMQWEITERNYRKSYGQVTRIYEVWVTLPLLQQKDSGGAARSPAYLLLIGINKWNRYLRSWKIGLRMPLLSLLLWYFCPCSGCIL